MAKQKGKWITWQGYEFYEIGPDTRVPLLISNLEYMSARKRWNDWNDQKRR